MDSTSTEKTIVEVTPNTLVKWYDVFLSFWKTTVLILARVVTKKNKQQDKQLTDHANMHNKKMQETTYTWK